MIQPTSLQSTSPRQPVARGRKTHHLVHCPLIGICSTMLNCSMGSMLGQDWDSKGIVMVTGAFKSRIDSIWDTMWSGGISNPLSVIEQLTYLLFIKRLDELHTLKERKAAHTGRPIQEPVFGVDQDGLRWSRFKDAAPEQMFETVRDRVFPFIKSLGQKDGIDGGGSTYGHHMKDALFMMPTPRVLANVVDQLDGNRYGRHRH